MSGRPTEAESAAYECVAGTQRRSEPPAPSLLLLNLISCLVAAATPTGQAWSWAWLDSLAGDLATPAEQ